MLTDSSTSAKVELPQKSIRQCAAEEAAFRRSVAATAERQRVREEREKVAGAFAAELRKRLRIEIDPADVKFKPDEPASVVVKDEPDDLVFVFRPSYYAGSDRGYAPAWLALAWTCDRGHLVTTTDIADYADLHERIVQADKWECGVNPCPVCEIARRDAQKLAEPPPPRPKTAAEKLAEGLTEFVREIVDEAREEA